LSRRALNYGVMLTPLSSRGFTLIEILVCLAVISLLAAILLPVLGRVRENGRRAACSSNLKQIALSFSQYLQDSDGRYPPDGTTPVDGWALGLQPYLRSESIFQCPSDDETAPAGATQLIRAQSPGFTDYYYNYNLGAGFLEAQLPKSSATVLLGEGGIGDSEPNAANYSRSTTPLMLSGGPLRHFQGANYAFADGHVKWQRLGAITDGDAGCDGGPNAPTKRDATFCAY
jgi:prepilin-type N-terminal cleavage/methylation domain-containing protein/prepilin-type processing-associated H-X9-DG protein